MQVIFKESASRRHGEVSGKKDVIGKMSDKGNSWILQGTLQSNYV